MNQNLEEKRINEFFRASVFLKGVHAVMEIIGGVLLFVIPPNVFIHLGVWLTQEELLEDSHDLIANYLLHASSGLSLGATMFGGLYLLSHGVIKIILVFALLKNKLWAYPWSLVVLGLFIVYQVYRFTLAHSIFLILLTIFDLIVMWLIWKEYGIMKPQPTN